MKITSAQLYEVFPPPFDEGVSDATLGPFFEFPVALLVLHTGDGLEGYGLAPVGGLTRLLLEEIYLPLLFAADLNVDDLESFWAECQRRTRNLGPGVTSYALASIDVALWDIAGKMRRAPLYQLLGGREAKIPVYGSNGFINYSLPKLLEGMTGLAERGFRLLKMKVGTGGGRDIEEDVRRVKAVRRELGPQIELAVDANQCWSVTQALEFANRVADENIKWLEEPIAANDFLGLTEISLKSPVHVAAGESLWTHYAFETLLDLKALKYAQPEPTVVGGVTGFAKTTRVAARFGAPVASGGFSQLTCSLVAAAQTGMITEYLVPFMDRFQEVWAVSPRLAEGHFHLSDTPGHGLTPDWDYVKDHSRSAPYIFEARAEAPFLRAY